MSAVLPDGIRNTFRIVDVELNDPVDGLYIHLKDKVTGVRIDIFGDERFMPETETTLVGEQDVNVRTAANLGALLLCIVSRQILEGAPSAPKRFIDLFALLEITDMEDIGRNWLSFPERTIGGDHTTNDHHKALRRVTRFVDAHPQSLQ